MKRLTLTAAGLVLSLSLFSCAPTTRNSANSPETSSPAKEAAALSACSSLPEDHPCTEALQALRAELENVSGGTMTLNIQSLPNEDEDLLSRIQDGVLEFALVDSSLLADCNFEFLFLAQPFLFDSPDEHVQILSDDSITSDLYTTILGDNIRVLGEFYCGTQSLAFRESIPAVPDDFTGLTIRIAAPMTTDTLFSSLGAEILTPDLLSVYDAAASPDVSALETDAISYLNDNIYENMPYYLETGHSMRSFALLASEEWWASLSDSVQASLLHALPAILADSCARVQEREKESLSILREQGRLASFDSAVLSEAASGSLDPFLQTDTCRNLYDAIRGNR